MDGGSTTTAARRPAGHSIVPSVNVAVTNDAGEVLLIRRSDKRQLALPGGAVDLGESLTQAAVRETGKKRRRLRHHWLVRHLTPTPVMCSFYTSNGEARRSSPSS